MRVYNFVHPVFLQRLASRLNDQFSALHTGDEDYIFHEFAHHIVLTRQAPKNNYSFKAISSMIGDMGQGQAQIHELRTIALQHATWHRLGFQTSLKRSIALSWSGLEDVADFSRCSNKKDSDNFFLPAGRKVITSKTQALRMTQSIQVSERNIATFIRALRSFARELGVSPHV